MTLTSDQSPPETTPGTLAERYQGVRDRIVAAAGRAGSDSGRIVLVAVTKFASIDEIRQLVELGHADFGESKVQNLQKRVVVIDEFLNRHRELSGGRQVSLPEAVRWHMIGHLQRNKVKKIASQVRLIHSVDSLRLVEELHSCAAKLDRSIELLIQHNAAGDSQKYGIAPAAVPHLLDQIDTMIGLKPRGLMCMAPLSDDPETSRPVFERCQELFEELVTAGVGGEQFNILSMGMSSDFEVAIECGANMVRVGSAIFGTTPNMDEDADE